MALEEGAVPIDDPSVSSAEKVALFFGCEGYGLTRPTLDAVGRSVIIPMSNGVDSLNVAASSAVAFWELFARRRQTVRGLLSSPSWHGFRTVRPA